MPDTESLSFVALTPDILFHLLTRGNVDSLSLVALSSCCSLFLRPFQHDGATLPLVQAAARKLCFQKSLQHHGRTHCKGNDSVFGYRKNVTWLRRLHHIETLQKRHRVNIAAGIAWTVGISPENRAVFLEFDRPNVPIPLLGNTVIVQVAASDLHTLLLSSAGQVYSFGSNSKGQCGVGHNRDLAVPTIITQLTSHFVKSTAAGWGSSAIITQEGDLFTFGAGEFIGQGGQSCALPTRMAAMAGYFVERIAMDDGHSILTARDTRGRQHLFGFGHNDNWQLGFETEDYIVSSPTLIPYFETQRHEVVQLAVGVRHSVALTLGGEVIAWGRRHSSVSQNFRDTFRPFVVNERSGTFYTYVAGGGYNFFGSTDLGQTFVFPSNREEQITALSGLEIQHISHNLISTRNGTVVKIVVRDTLYKRFKFSVGKYAKVCSC